MKGLGLSEVAVTDLMKLALIFRVEEMCWQRTRDVFQGSESGWEGKGEIMLAGVLRKFKALLKLLC